MPRQKNKSRSVRVLLLVICALLLPGALGCSKKSGQTASGSDKAVVVTVNGESVNGESFKRELKHMKRKFHLEKPGDFNPEQLLWLKTNALNQIIQEMLFRQAAAKNDVQVSREEFEQTMQQLKRDYQEDSFQRYLDIESITLEEWQNKLKNNLLIKNLINKMVNSKVSISESELKEYFDKRSEEFQKKEQIHALHIMLETEEEARNILKQIASGKKDFSQLAKEYSLGPEGARGGDLGYFEMGHMPEEFDDVFKLNVNEVSGIINTPYGYHIFKAIDKKPGQKMSFEESKKLIHGKLLQARQEKAFQEWVRKLKDEATIEINYEVLAQLD